MEVPKFLQVNVSGRPYWLLTANVLQHPESRLCKLINAFYDTHTDTSHANYEDAQPHLARTDSPATQRHNLQRRHNAAKQWCDEIFYNNDGAEPKTTNPNTEYAINPYAVEELDETCHLLPPADQWAAEIGSVTEKAINPFAAMNSNNNPNVDSVSTKVQYNPNSDLQLEVIRDVHDPSNPPNPRNSSPMLSVNGINSNNNISYSNPTTPKREPRRSQSYLGVARGRQASFRSYQLQTPSVYHSTVGMHHADTPNPVFYFMRSPALFEATVLQSVATGATQTVPSSDIDGSAIRAEMEYWGLSVTGRAPRVGFRCNDVSSNAGKENNSGDVLLEIEDGPTNGKGGSKFFLARRFIRLRRSKHRVRRSRYEGSRRQKIHNALECQGQFGRWTHVISTLQILTLALILINVFLVVIDSIPAYHWSAIVSAHFMPVRQCTSTTLLANTSLDGSLLNESLAEPINIFSSEGMYIIPPETPFGEPNPSYLVMIVFRALDWICTIWFTVEYLLRLWSAHKRCRFIFHPMSVIDLLATVPTYLELAFSYNVLDQGCWDRTVHELAVLKVLRIFRLVRVFRVLKLARYEKSFMTLAQCLKSSLRELSLLVVFLLVSTVLFGSLLFFAERGQPDTPFKDIPNAVWWSIVTFFGYADAPPVGVWGKIVSGMAAIWGVVFMAFPISIMVNRFSDFYEKEVVPASKDKAKENKQSS